MKSPLLKILVLATTLFSSASFAAIHFNLDKTAAQKYDTVTMEKGVQAAQISSGGNINDQSYVGDIIAGPIHFFQNGKLNGALTNIAKFMIPNINDQLTALANTANLTDFSPVKGGPPFSGVKFIFQKGSTTKTCFVAINQSNYQETKTITLPEDCQ